jgi:hypothetical protein
MLQLILLAATQTPAPPAIETPAAPPQLPVILTKGTPIKLALLRPLSSQNSPVGTNVVFTLAENVMDDKGHILLPARTLVFGKVTARERPNITHWTGLIGIDADLVSVKDNQGNFIPIHIKATDKKYDDFRTRRSLAPPKPSEAARADFKSNRQPILDKILTYTDFLKRKPNGTFRNPLTDNSAVMLSQLFDPKDAAQVLPKLTDPSFVDSMRSVKSIPQATKFLNQIGMGSAITIVGIGFGIWELYDLIRGFFHEATIASGTFFDAYVAQDSQIMVDVSQKEIHHRRAWNMRVPILAPRKFAHTHNVVAQMTPWPRYSVKHKRAG